MLEAATVDALARELYEARRSRTLLRHFSLRHPTMTIEDGYAIQRAWMIFFFKQKTAYEVET